MYNSLVERCFKDCVDSFRRKDMEPAEEKVKEDFFLLQFFSRVFLSPFFLSKLTSPPPKKLELPQKNSASPSAAKSI